MIFLLVALVLEYFARPSPRPAQARMPTTRRGPKPTPAGRSVVLIAHAHVPGGLGGTRHEPTTEVQSWNYTGFTSDDLR